MILRHLPSSEKPGWKLQAYLNYSSFKLSDGFFEQGEDDKGLDAHPTGHQILDVLPHFVMVIYSNPSPAQTRRDEDPLMNVELQTWIMSSGENTRSADSVNRGLDSSFTSTKTAGLVYQTRSATLRSRESSGDPIVLSQSDI